MTFSRPRMGERPEIRSRRAETIKLHSIRGSTPSLHLPSDAAKKYIVDTPRRIVKIPRRQGRSEPSDQAVFEYTVRERGERERRIRGISTMHAKNGVHASSRAPQTRSLRCAVAQTRRDYHDAKADAKADGPAITHVLIGMRLVPGDRKHIAFFVYRRYSPSHRQDSP